MGMTQYESQKYLNACFRGQAYTPPTKIMVGLFTAVPSFLGDESNEVSDSGYSRIDAADGGTVDTGWNQPDVNGKVSNAKTLQFGKVADAPVPVAAMAFFDESGNMLQYKALPSTVTLAIDETIYWDAGTVFVDAGKQ